MAKKHRTISSQRWLKRHEKDIYVKKAKDLNYRSRAIFKIQDIQKKFSLLHSGDWVLELGSAPGGWTQYMLSLQMHVVTIDLKDTKPFDGVKHFVGDILDETFLDTFMSFLKNQDDSSYPINNGKKFHGLVSDIAPNATGHMWLDSQKSADLVLCAIHWAVRVLKSGGYFISKYLLGEADSEIMNMLHVHFDHVKRYTSVVSYKNSREIYYVATSYNGG